MDSEDKQPCVRCKTLCEYAGIFDPREFSVAWLCGGCYKWVAEQRLKRKAERKKLG